ncbi:Sua5/YciO/YrdC/YwlC family protein [Moraxella oblonga]|uniref:Sua5/YciO/YrdC/YwlC family protein n=1 Tax=Moraxella oblonga TaxID=200413 RepID=UPI00082B9B41|nr:Sua5/YciO/YrdC/YwlC family protein [Moraxella oblonga]
MKTLYIHPDNPQARLMNDVVSALQSGEPVIIPTENGYRFAFGMNAKDAFETVKRLGVSESDLVLICQNISELSSVAVVDNVAFTTLKSDFLPQNVFILEPTKAINKKIITKKSLNFSTSATPVMTMLLQMLGEPIFIAPLVYQGERAIWHYEIADNFETQVAVFVDVGVVDDMTVNVVDLVD